MAKTSKGVMSIAEAAKHGRNGDTMLVHVSPQEAALGADAQGQWSINPETGLPEFFSFGNVLKSVAKAAGALVGGYFGGPAGAALGAGAATKLTGGSWKDALTTGAISGIGAYGLQQTGLGDGFGGFGSNTNLLGQPNVDTASAARIGSVSGPSVGGSSGSGFSISKLLPIASIAAASLAGSPKVAQAPVQTVANDQVNAGPDWSKYQPIARQQQPYYGDYLTYGQTGGENSFYDHVNPQPVIAAANGGKILHMKYGGDTHEGGATGSQSGGAGTAGHDSGANGGGAPSGGYAGSRNPNGSLANGNTPGTGGGYVGGGSQGPKSTVGGMGTNPHGFGSSAAESAANNSVPGPGANSLSHSNQQNVSSAYRDYAGVGDTTMDKIGNALAGLVGIHEMDPTQSNSPVAGPHAANVTGQANWGIDPVRAALTVGGMFNPAMSVGSMLYGVANRFGVKAPDIDLGPQVFGSAPSFEGYSGSTSPSGQNNSPARTPGAGTNGQGGQPSIDPGSSASPKPVSSISQVASAAPTGSTASTPGRQYLGYNGDYLTYGMRPENQFWTPMQYAGGGDVAGQSGPGGFQGPVSGPGGGQDDLIPAQLASGEHVFDADVVSSLGDGSNDEGHRKLEEFKASLRAHKRSAPTNKIPPKTKALSSYMKSRAA